MRRLGTLLLSTVLLASPFLGSATYAGSTAAAGSGHHGTRGHDHGGPLSWKETVIDADQSFRGLDAVDRRTAWVTGGSATEGGPGRVFRTTDGGRTWQDVSPPGTEGLLFRDVEARSAKTGRDPGHRAGRRVADLPHHRRRGDLGRGLRQRRPRGVLRLHGVLPRRPARAGDERPGRREVPDPRHRRLRPLVDRPPERRHAARPRRSTASPPAATASSRPATTAYFGSGGGAARVFRSNDFGLTWTATDSTIPAGEAAGVFALAFRTPRQGIAVGGDFADPADGVDAVATTRHGSTWRNAGDLSHLAEDVAYLPGRGQPADRHRRVR